MVRFTDYCVNNNLPIIEQIEPLQLNEVRGIRTRQKKADYEFEGEGDLIEDVQWKRTTLAVIANVESRIEIMKNVFRIPMATKNGSLEGIWKATGVLDDDAVDAEQFVILHNFVTRKLTLFERCDQVWSSFLPGSSFYQPFPNVFDWGKTEEGALIPKGAPMGKEKCEEKFNELLNKIDGDISKSGKFSKNTFDAVVEMLKIGRIAFPGLVIRDPGLDLVVKGMLRACLMETIQEFISGKGQSSYLDDIWRELRQFDLIATNKDPKFIPRPMVTVYASGQTGNMIRLIDWTKEITDSASKRTVNGAVEIKIQTRSLTTEKYHVYCPMLFYKLHNMDLMRIFGQNMGQLPRFNVYEIRPACTEEEPKKKKEKLPMKIQPGRKYKEEKDLEQKTALL